MFGLMNIVGRVEMICDICGKDLDKVQDCAWTSCPLLWDEQRIDQVGQNGNNGEHYDEL
jgi:hypothetical protein